MRLGLYLFANAGSLIDAIFCCSFCAFQSYLIQQRMSGIFGVVTGFCVAVFRWNLQLKPPPRMEFALQFLAVDITWCLIRWWCFRWFPAGNTTAVEFWGQHSDDMCLSAITRPCHDLPRASSHGGHCPEGRLVASKQVAAEPAMGSDQPCWTAGQSICWQCLKLTIYLWITCKEHTG
jgi:hypothetical protein